jgi:glutamate synthase domain-containing protein 3
MTGGIVLVLGRAGRNFGAGMSNGVAYVVDEAGTFESRVNRDMVELGSLDEQDLALVRQLVREHEEKTASPRARRMLVQWDQFVPMFRKVVPRGAAQLVSAARDAYLQAVPVELELVPARRSA